MVKVFQIPLKLGIRYQKCPSRKVNEEVKDVSQGDRIGSSAVASDVSPAIHNIR